MAEIDTNAIDELKNTLGQNPDKYQAWQTFGQKYINDPEAFSKFAAMPSILTDCGYTYRAGKIQTPDDVIAEHKRIRISKAIPDPEIHFLYGSVGFGNRENPHYALFYNIDNLELQIRNYSLGDQGWQFFTQDGNILVDNAFWLNMVAHATRDIKNIAYISQDACRAIFAHQTCTAELNIPLIPIIGRRNYYHFMIDQLPFILLAQHIREMKNFSVAFSTMHKTQQELCGVYGAKTDSFVELEKLTGEKSPNTFQIKNAYIPAYVPLPVRLTLLRMVISAGKLRTGHLNIFLCRKPSPNVSPRLSNQAELEKVLSANGFQIVYAEDYSVAQQKELFSKAKIVVGAHGAGLTNMMFAPRNSLLIEIMNEVSNKNPMGYCEGFRRICSCNGQNYMRLVCPVDADSPKTIEQNLHMTCAPDRLMKLVEAASEALGL